MRRDIIGSRIIWRLAAFMVLLTASSLLWHCQAFSNSPELKVHVIKVHDGDTVTLMINGRMRKTRLIGIDAPEMNQRPWGRQAKEHLIDIMNHTDWIVTMETDAVTTDKYGRSLVFLWTNNNELINERMVLDGYAVLFTIRPNVRYKDNFTRAEQRARQERKGIWGVNGLKEAPVKYREKHPRKQYR